MTNRSYKDLVKIRNFDDRLDYLMLSGSVGDFTFNGNRYVNQQLYRSPEWKRIRREIILRDNGCDLAHPEYSVEKYIYIHHINPITVENILRRDYCVFDPDNLVCVSLRTHNEIHYGVKFEYSQNKPKLPSERYEGDTTLW